MTIPGRYEGYCCGVTGQDGPNLACAHCGHPVGARVDDCSLWQAVWLEPDAIRTVPAGPALPVADWTDLLHDRHAVPPLDANGRWRYRYEQEASVTLAALILAAEGSPVVFEDDTAAALLDRGLRRHRPGTAGTAKRCALHGPGRPLTNRHSELALVPCHPQTGRPWPTPSGVTGIPLDLAIWRYLAFPPLRSAVHVPGPLRAELDRDDPPPPRRHIGIWFDGRLIGDLLARHPVPRPA
ncbi:hypothetical protein ACFV4P_12030 [Kitasatospora sp. NPDC059795]|uniref:hypothetical protein n=1 Tax=Kitasatospora sp. NPDC059795 TaxID=3346949 RepID=UPI00364D5296